MSAPLLAHLGGAPEALTIALPAAIFGGFMLLERRARRREREAAQHPVQQDQVQRDQVQRDEVQQDDGPAPEAPKS